MDIAMDATVDRQSRLRRDTPESGTRAEDATMHRTTPFTARRRRRQPKPRVASKEEFVAEPLAKRQ